VIADAVEPKLQLKDKFYGRASTGMSVRAKRENVGFGAGASSLALALAGALVLLVSCAVLTATRQTADDVSWSSFEPLAIPYDVRLTQFEKGNLVANASFEDGGPSTDKADSAFEPLHWTPIGRGVEWVVLESERQAPEEVDAGGHAVRIVKKTAGELDATAGIISDFIPVIPGNYDFWYHIKLKDISSQKSRLGSRLHDALVVKTLFFDAQKKEIDPAVLNQVTATLIDNSDKSFSFSNFWRIDDFPLLF
jgi:hypothetical protein